MFYWIRQCWKIFPKNKLIRLRSGIIVSNVCLHDSLTWKHHVMCMHVIFDRNTLLTCFTERFFVAFVLVVLLIKLFWMSRETFQFTDLLKFPRSKWKSCECFHGRMLLLFHENSVIFCPALSFLQIYVIQRSKFDK